MLSLEPSSYNLLTSYLFTRMFWLKEPIYTLLGMVLMTIILGLILQFSWITLWAAIKDDFPHYYHSLY